MKIILYGTLNPVKKLTGVINAVPNPSLPPPPENRIFLVDRAGYIMKDVAGFMLRVEK